MASRRTIMSMYQYTTQLVPQGTAHPVRPLVALRRTAGVSVTCTSTLLDLRSISDGCSGRAKYEMKNNRKGKQMNNISHFAALVALFGTTPIHAAPDTGLTLHDTGIGQRGSGVGATVGLRIQLGSDWTCNGFAPASYRIMSPRLRMRLG